MSTDVLMRRFARIGARLRVQDSPWLGEPRIDVRRDAWGEYFDLSFTGGDREVDVEVVHLHRESRHLVLLVRDGSDKSRFLCGQDERHWFVAAIPESARGISGVSAAMRALQPDVVRAAVERKRPRDPLARRNTAFARQGEWFFVPTPHLEVDEQRVLRNERIARGGGQVHVLEFAYRRGGQTVYVSRRYPNGLTEAEFSRLSDDARRGSWQKFVRDAEVFAMGTVRHPDHQTIRLDGWHRVLMNTEPQARAMRHVAFLD